MMMLWLCTCSSDEILELANQPMSMRSRFVRMSAKMAMLLREQRWRVRFSFLKDFCEGSFPGSDVGFLALTLRRLRASLGRGANAACSFWGAGVAIVGHVVIGEGVSSSLTLLEPREGWSIWDVLLGIQADSFILIGELLGALFVVFPKIDVAAGNCGAFSHTGDGDGVAIYIADVDVISASGAAFDLAVCGMIESAEIDSPCPTGGVDNCG